MERNATIVKLKKAETSQNCDGCPARNIRSLVGDMISQNWTATQAGFTASARAENEGVKNELLRHCCPFVLQRQSKPIHNRINESLLVVNQVRAAKRLPRKSHTCSMGLRSEIVPANPYVQYPVISKSCSAATVR
ncbi:hypothetical protein TNCV_3516311 [Trichonephila clavipes]|nr:hypothetical protein TNCV_3516311 [Trichonephila clavipes]